MYEVDVRVHEHVHGKEYVNVHVLLDVLVLNYRRLRHSTTKPRHVFVTPLPKFPVGGPLMF